MNIIETNFNIPRTLVIQDSTDKLLGVFPVQSGLQNITDRIVLALEEEFMCGEGEVTIVKGCRVSDLGSITEFAIEVFDTDNEDTTRYQYYLHDATIY